MGTCVLAGCQNVAAAELGCMVLDLIDYSKLAVHALIVGYLRLCTCALQCSSSML
jgi:hypothetical protein